MEHGKLVITCRNPWELKQLAGMLQNGGTYDIGEHKELRSMQANKYMWALCNEISAAIRSTKEDVYRDAIKRVGIYKEFDPLPPDQAKTLQAAWGQIGTGWLSEQVDYDTAGENVIIRCYYGSSKYNTKQMARLIDDLTQEAEQLGIPTYDSERIDALMEEYDREYKRVHGTA